MTFNDILDSTFLENLESVSVADTLAALGVALVLGLLIFFVYKKTYRGVLYSASFGISLIALTLITTLVILAVSSNVVLSLGMVGALSIVRFRAAIKDPMDLVFLFWAIAVGIVLAAGLMALAAIASVIIAVVVILASLIKTSDDPYMLVLAVEDGDAETAVTSLLPGRVKKLKIKSKTVSPGLIELNYEIRLLSNDTSFVEEVAKMNGVKNIAIVSFGGEYMSQ